MKIAQVIAFVNAVYKSPHLSTHLESALGFGCVPDEIDMVNASCRLFGEPGLGSDANWLKKWFTLFDYLQDVVDTFNDAIEDADKTFVVRSCAEGETDLKICERIGLK